MLVCGKEHRMQIQTNRSHLAHPFISFVPKGMCPHLYELQFLIFETGAIIPPFQCCGEDYMKTHVHGSAGHTWYLVGK